MQAALELEKKVNQALLELHKLASDKVDPHVSVLLLSLGGRGQEPVSSGLRSGLLTPLPPLLQQEEDRRKQRNTCLLSEVLGGYGMGCDERQLQQFHNITTQKGL
ncbi:FRI2 protein, partial [Atractosteus spatula]|nr:FRI2 protein [Atractosteus spatula]